MNLADLEAQDPTVELSHLIRNQRSATLVNKADSVVSIPVVLHPHLNVACMLQICSVVAPTCPKYVITCPHKGAPDKSNFA